MVPARSLFLHLAAAAATNDTWDSGFGDSITRRQSTYSGNWHSVNNPLNLIHNVTAASKAFRGGWYEGTYTAEDGRPSMTISFTGVFGLVFKSFTTVVILGADACL